jgi:protein-S-isoprenylcysteine O-methyltransferase Ste14
MSEETKLPQFGNYGRYLSGVMMLAGVAAAMFWIAGRWTWVQGWAFLSFFVVYVSALSCWLSRTNPGLYRERTRKADNVEPWDLWVIRCYNFLLIALVIVAALDGGRFCWSHVPVALELSGWVGLCLSAAMIWHVMATNDFTSSWARLQSDRNQVVVTGGAYQWIRHPMYLGVIVSAVSIPLVLGSYWALVPGVLVVLVIVYRTAREDGMLIRELSGYREYSQTVRYRLIPGIW